VADARKDKTDVPYHFAFFTDFPVFSVLPALPTTVPTTVTPLPDLTRLLSAASFSCLALCLDLADPLGALVMACLSAALLNMTRILFLTLRSFVCRASFSMRLSSLRAGTSEEDVGARTSSGASMLAIERVEGSADSREAAGRSETVVMVAFGYHARPLVTGKKKGGYENVPA